MSNVSISATWRGLGTSILLDGEEMSKAVKSYKLSGSATTATMLEVELVPQCVDLKGEVDVIAVINGKRYNLIPLNPEVGGD